MYTGGIKRLDGDEVRMRAEAPPPSSQREKQKNGEGRVKVEAVEMLKERRERLRG